jgi:hypothetical protein
MVELWTRKREMEDDDEYDMEDTSMRIPEYHLPDCDGMTSYRCNDTPNQDSYLLFRGW